MPSIRWTVMLSFVSAAAWAQSVELVPVLKTQPNTAEIAVAVSGGGGVATVNHSLLKATFPAALVALNASVNFGMWTVGGELSAFGHQVSRPGATDSFAARAASGVGCNRCREPVAGGAVLSTAATFGTLGPRVDFSPWGKNGPFVGASGGLAYVGGFSDQLGGWVAGRAGLRYRLFRALELSAEGGFQAQWYADGSSATFPNGRAVARLFF